MPEGFMEEFMNNAQGSPQPVLAMGGPQWVAIRGLRKGNRTGVKADHGNGYLTWVWGTLT